METQQVSSAWKLPPRPDKVEPVVWFRVDKRTVPVAERDAPYTREHGFVEQPWDETELYALELHTTKLKFRTVHRSVDQPYFPHILISFDSQKTVIIADLYATQPGFDQVKQTIYAIEGVPELEAHLTLFLDPLSTDTERFVGGFNQKTDGSMTLIPYSFPRRWTWMTHVGTEIDFALAYEIGDSKRPIPLARLREVIHEVIANNNFAIEDTLRRMGA